MIVQETTTFDESASGEMDCADSLRGKRSNHRARVESKICGVRVEIVKIEEQIGFCRIGHRGQPLSFVVDAERRIDERCDVLEQRCSADDASRLSNISRQAL